MMKLSTTRFGQVAVDDLDVVTFANGLIGLEGCQRWVLLADARNTALAWLQSVDFPEVALAVVSPRRFVPDYQVRVARRDLEPLGLAGPQDAQVLVIVSRQGDGLSLNLKAPLVIHLQQRLGRQLVARNDHPVQHPLPAATRLRMTG
jgi:flagellar assembly factor FliW